MKKVNNDELLIELAKHFMPFTIKFHFYIFISITFKSDEMS